jgi:predicted enzyme related to lactoylglutathione lyase
VGGDVSAETVPTVVVQSATPQFTVPDVVRAAEYYRDVFGFEITGYWDGERVSFKADPPPVFGIVRRGQIFKPGDMPENGATVWSLFPSTTRYFRPSAKAHMINLVVDDLERVLQQVRQGGGRIVGDVKEYSYGRFGWFLDPDRNKVELWQPPPRRGRRGASKK